MKTFKFSIYTCWAFWAFSACWAFAAIASLESAIFLKTGQSMSLSEQQLVDCTYRSYGRDGCNGGSRIEAYNYLISSIGNDKTDSYPVRICVLF